MGKADDAHLIYIYPLVAFLDSSQQYLSQEALHCVDCPQVEVDTWNSGEVLVEERGRAAGGL